MFDVKTRFRFSSEGGVGEKTRFGGGRFVIGTPSLPSHKHLSYPSSHKPLSHISPTLHKHLLPSIPSHTHLTHNKKNRIDRNQSYLKHDLINLLN